MSDSALNKLSRDIIQLGRAILAHYDEVERERTTSLLIAKANAHIELAKCSKCEHRACEKHATKHDPRIGYFCDEHADDLTRAFPQDHVSSAHFADLREAAMVRALEELLRAR